MPFISFTFTSNKSRAKLEETKLVQKLRQKQNGINAIALAIGQKVTEEDLLLKVSHTYTQCLLMYPK